MGVCTLDSILSKALTTPLQSTSPVFVLDSFVFHFISYALLKMEEVCPAALSLMLQWLGFVFPTLWPRFELSTPSAVKMIKEAGCVLAQEQSLAMPIIHTTSSSLTRNTAWKSVEIENLSNPAHSLSLYFSV